MRIFGFVILAAGLFCLAQPVRAEPAADANPDLAKALQKATGVENYTFRIEEEPKAGPGAVEGRYQKGQPVSFQSGGIEFFRKGTVLVYKQGEHWQRSKTGTESDPLRVLGASAPVRAARLPHEELSGLEKHLRDVRVADDKEKDGKLYSGTLDDDAVKGLARSEHQSVARSGTLRVWINGDGKVTKYEVAIKLQGRLGNAEVDGSATRTVVVGDVGSTRVETPDEVKKLLE